MARIYKKNDDVVSRPVAGETIIVPVKNRVADMRYIFSVNAVGAFVWEHVDGKKTVSELLDTVLDCFQVEPSEAKQDIVQFIDQLRDAGLIETVE